MVMTRIVISGTGFIGRGLALALCQQPRFALTGIYTRRRPSDVEHPTAELLSNDLSHCLSDCDILVECSGDVLHACDVIDAAHQRNIPVVTMNSEFHVTVGSAFLDSGYLTEAEGDQPGCLAALHRRVTAMGFEPVVLGNIKGFLNHTPTAEDMKMWSQKQGISLDQVTAFTDGTKIQIEQAFVANGLGANILQDGLAGPSSAQLQDAAKLLAQRAEQEQCAPISDYVLNAGGPPGVFIVARHEQAQQPLLQYLKLGEGPFYFLLQPFHLCHLEILHTLDAVVAEAKPLLNNGRTPTVGVVAVAKQPIHAGDTLERAIGSFTLRGEARMFCEHEKYVPIGLLQHVTFTHDIPAGAAVEWQHVTLPHSRALILFRQLLDKSIQ
ncbi:MAG: NAD(P)-dependent oxidoreductase [Gammaproteobacteria bacterium]|nr:NAD(P)-dependent oxidoreductase [Gammaproteobacteria bacterium]MBQ0775526.1 NAD(P)-dependent oxidoreductase [Gammaproteobacteria bacterium]